MGAVVKTLRRSNSPSQSIFSTVGPFGTPRFATWRLRLLFPCVSTGLLQSEVLGEVCVWRGAVRDKVFGEVFGEVLLGHSEQKNFSKNFSSKISRLRAAKLALIQGKNFMTRFCRRTPPIHVPSATKTFPTRKNSVRVDLFKYRHPVGSFPN